MQFAGWNQPWCGSLPGINLGAVLFWVLGLFEFIAIAAKRRTTARCSSLVAVDLARGDGVGLGVAFEAATDRCSQIELTNNRVERELRKLVLGRRNWLFTWEDLGGERTAAILTIVATCVSYGVNPRAYLHLATKLILEGWPQAKLRDLLPDRLAIAHQDLLLADGALRSPLLSLLATPPATDR